MKVNRGQLLRQLEAVSPGLSKREILEQSDHFCFKDGRVITFNDEVACSTDVELKIEGAVPSNPMLALLRKLSEEEVEMKLEDGELRVQGDKRRAGIRVEAEVSLPIEGIEEPGKWREVPSELIEAIKVVGHCAGHNESLFKLTCIHLHPEWVEACDNYQMARYPLETGLAKPTLVRQAALSGVLTRDMKQWSDTENWLHFCMADGLILSLRRYMEEYSDLSKILVVTGMPAKLPKGLEDALSKAEIFTADRDDANLVKVELRKGRMKLTGRGPQGWYAEQRKVDYSGEDLAFMVSPKLLLEITKRADTCEITEGRLKVDGGKFTWVACTSKPDKEE